MNFPFEVPKPLPKDEQFKLVLLAKAGDIEAQNKLIATNTRLTIYMASKYERTYRGDPLDLFSIAVLAYYPAIKNFNPTRSDNFPYFAVQYMRRDLSRFIINNISQVKFATSSKMIGAVSRISKLLGTKPDIKTEEVAAKFKLSFEDADKIMTALKFKHVNLDKRVSGEHNDDFTSLKDYLTDASPLPDAQISSIEQDEQASILLHQAIETLPEFQQKVVRLYLLADPKRTLPEVGKMLGCTGEWVRRSAEMAKRAIKEYIEGAE